MSDALTAQSAMFDALAEALTADGNNVHAYTLLDWCADRLTRVVNGEELGSEGYDSLRFTPLTIIRGEKGKLAHDNLNWLKSQYRAEQDNLSKHYCNLALGLAPFLKQCKHTSAYRKAKA